MVFLICSFTNFVYSSFKTEWTILILKKAVLISMSNYGWLSYIITDRTK